MVVYKLSLLPWFFRILFDLIDDKYRGDDDIEYGSDDKCHKKIKGDFALHLCPLVILLFIITQKLFLIIY